MAGGIKDKQTKNFTISYEDYEFSSEEFVFIAFSILESQKYYGLIELMSIVEDPGLIMKIIYLMNGMTIKFPTPTEFAKCLKAASYIYTDALKQVTSTVKAKPADIRQTMGISEEEEKELLDMFDNWVVYMHKQGYEVDDFIKFQRKNTKKRIKDIKVGKKWTARRY